MKDFAFHRPASVKDAVALLRAHSSGKVLAGGQSLLPVLKLELAEPSDLVSLGQLKELRDIRVDGGKLAIGALATHDQVHHSAEVKKAIPALAHLAGGIGDAQVRNRGTIGGSVAHADPAADYPAALVGLGATVITDRRSIAADDFFTGLFTTALAADELVTAVQFPVPKRAAYAKFAHRASKYALVGVFVAETAGGVRVAVTGAGPKVFRLAAYEAALGKKLAPASLDGIAVSSADLNGDAEASAEYRAHLIGVMARRAIQALA
ncbi:MAG: xanthine dehydrogenase family protein subunit M [Deltaproteobacteria bacterium]|nr:MAG: xanthine dehydrogenase family protein subunit M [Deltaproteobacteria bacterium]TMQ24577.1 MAG: xanthine dehydrogenase family protein subunit M [Deltaproteobacteria bacterium]